GVNACCCENLITIMTESILSIKQNVARSISPSLSTSTSDDSTKSLQQQILSIEAKIDAFLGLDSKVVVENTLNALDAGHLVLDVLDIRPINSKNKTILEDADRRKTKLSYIVQFKSYYVARYVIRLKKRKGLLSANQVLNCNLVGNIYVNEFLNPQTYALYNKTKELARAHKCKYVWVTDGKISVRRDDGTNIISINTDQDLTLITTMS
ncbi:hypothetical protein PV326_012670, partial [Microctonus aethiopoides]